MMMSDKSKQHVDSCRFCWMCHHICPIGNATGHERCTPRARALGISLVNRDAMKLEEIMDNIYECVGCGACVDGCVTGWDPVMFTREVRLEAALEGKLPAYIQKLVENCLTTGNAYGKTATCEKLAAAVAAHARKENTLFYLGADAAYMACTQGAKAIKVLEKAGVAFSMLEKEPACGTQLEFLIGNAEETKAAMAAAAKVFDAYETVVLYDPADARTVKVLFAEYGIKTAAKVVTYTAYLAELVKSGKLTGTKSAKTVVFQDPYQLARDLGETEAAREVISAFAELHEMLLNRKETVFAGNILMAQYMPEVIKNVAARRIFNAKSIGETAMVTASVSEHAALKSVGDPAVEILSLEDLILGE